MLHARGAEPVHVPAYSVKVRDVSGAGDTVVAVLAVMLALGADYESAMRAANAAAAVVVGKRGTATVSAAELRARILPSATLAPEEKIVFDWRELDERLGAWRAQDLRIGFTNGVFDLLHPGHIKVLAQARAACDRLVVGLNSDASVRRLKGEGRPIQSEHARAEVLAALEAVDLVARVRTGHAARTDPPGAPDRAGQGRRLPARTGGRARARRGAGRRGGAGRSGAGLQHDADRRALAQAPLTPRKAGTWACSRRSRKRRRWSGVFRRFDERLFCRGRRQPSDHRLADLALEQVRLDRRADRAATRSRGVSGHARARPRCSRSPARRRRTPAGRCRCTSMARSRRSIATRMAPGRGRELRHHGADPNARRHPGRGRGARRRSICCRSMSRATRSRCCTASISRSWQPRLILIEDHVVDLRKHRFLQADGYRLIRRVGNNGWYVPARPTR